jgi:hypothetical protein
MPQMEAMMERSAEAKIGDIPWLENLMVVWLNPQTKVTIMMVMMALRSKCSLL